MIEKEFIELLQTYAEAVVEENNKRREAMNGQFYLAVYEDLTGIRRWLGNDKKFI